MEKLYKIIILIFFFNGIISCATDEKQEKVLESNLYKKPLWSEKREWEDEKYIYFSNHIKTKREPIKGLRKSKENLIKKIYPSLKNRFIKEFEDKTDDIDFSDIDKIKFEFINKLMELMDVDHLIPDGIYYEKVMDNDNTIYFHCYTYKAFSKEIIKEKKIKTIEYLIKEYRGDNKKETNLLKLKEFYK